MKQNTFPSLIVVTGVAVSMIIRPVRLFGSVLRSRRLQKKQVLRETRLITMLVEPNSPSAAESSSGLIRYLIARRVNVAVLLTPNVCIADFLLTSIVFGLRSRIVAISDRVQPRLTSRTTSRCRRVKSRTRSFNVRGISAIFSFLGHLHNQPPAQNHAKRTICHRGDSAPDPTSRPVGGRGCGRRRLATIILSNTSAVSPAQCWPSLLVVASLAPE